MKISQPEITVTSKRRGLWSWLGCLTPLLGLPLLFYYGYCWGLWGRQSLLLQYFFQCKCPAASQEARYPRRVDVVVSACRQAGVGLSPSGRLLYVREKKDGLISTYLLDLRTHDKIPFAIPEGSNYFLTDDLLFLSLHYGLGDHILDRTTGKQYPIQKFAYWRSDAFINGQANPSVLAQALQAAETVFFIKDSDVLVALMPDFHNHPESNFFLRQSDFPGHETDRLEQFLRENNITYQTIPANFPDEAVSPDRRLVARADGIYLAETGKKIIEGYSASIFYRPYSRKYFAVRGWMYDGSGVIYSKFLNPCLFETKFLFGDDTGCFYEVPQPVILLKVPAEYLSPTETP